MASTLLRFATMNGREDPRMNSSNAEKLKKVLVLNTGGTIGMKQTEKGGYLIKTKYLEKIKIYPGLCDPDYHIKMDRDWVNMGSFSPIPLPCTHEGYRILYTFLDYCSLVDSSNISMEDWASFGRHVLQYYHQFNGFVILHGTDTMAYTASALSFMLENLGKTVILTGSQVPISELRNDARDNFLSSIILAGQYIIPEIRSFLQAPMEGVILQTYGVGNVPETDSHSYLFQELEAACNRGVIIVNCTQCCKGFVKEKYAGGIKLCRVGIIPGGDMTVEAALTKLSYLLAGKLTKEQIKEEMTRNLRGELTVLDSRHTQLFLKNSRFLGDVASALNICSIKEVKMLKTMLFPPLMCAAAASGNSQCLQDLKLQGGDFNNPDYDGRTPLHLACCEGHLETVQYLLENGASVHVTDRFNQTPLDNADTFKKEDVIKLLLQTGAERNLSSQDLTLPQLKQRT